METMDVDNTPPTLKEDASLKTKSTIHTRRLDENSKTLKDIRRAPLAMDSDEESDSESSKLVVYPSKQNSSRLSLTEAD